MLQFTSCSPPTLPRPSELKTRQVLHGFQGLSSTERASGEAKGVAARRCGDAGGGLQLKVAGGVDHVIVNFVQAGVVERAKGEGLSGEDANRAVLKVGVLTVRSTL